MGVNLIEGCVPIEEEIPSVIGPIRSWVYRLALQPGTIHGKRDNCDDYGESESQCHLHHPSVIGQNYRVFLRCG